MGRGAREVKGDARPRLRGTRDGKGCEVRDARSEERKKGECNPNELWSAKAIKALMSVIS